MLSMRRGLVRGRLSQTPLIYTPAKGQYVGQNHTDYGAHSQILSHLATPDVPLLKTPLVCQTFHTLLAMPLIAEHSSQKV